MKEKIVEKIKELLVREKAGERETERERDESITDRHRNPYPLQLELNAKENSIVKKIIGKRQK